MGLGHTLAKTFGRALRSVHAGTEKLTSTKLGERRGAALEVTSSAFGAGQTLPRSSTVEGEGAPPAITWTRVPAEARSIVVVCEDPDAPLPEPFVHWIVYGLRAEDGVLDADLLGRARQGRNSKGGKGFAPIAPPPGHGVHHYHFQAFALDVDVPLEEGAGRAAIVDAMRGHVVAWGDLVGTYERT